MEAVKEVICSCCNGSGEGMYDGNTCPVCNGLGEQIIECSEDDPEALEVLVDNEPDFDVLDIDESLWDGPL